MQEDYSDLQTELADSRLRAEEEKVSLQASLDQVQKKLRAITETHAELQSRCSKWKETAEGQASQLAQLEAKLQVTHKECEEKTRKINDLSEELLLSKSKSEVIQQGSHELQELLQVANDENKRTNSKLQVTLVF